jgi:hypothetical protein
MQIPLAPIPLAPIPLAPIPLAPIPLAPIPLAPIPLAQMLLCEASPPGGHARRRVLLLNAVAHVCGGRTEHFIELVTPNRVPQLHLVGLLLYHIKLHIRAA